MKTVDRIRIAAGWSGWTHLQRAGAEDDYFAKGRKVIRVIYDARGGLHSAHKWDRAHRWEKDQKKKVFRLGWNIPFKLERVLDWFGAK